MKRLVVRLAPALAAVLGLFAIQAPAWAYTYDYTNPSGTGCAGSGAPANPNVVSVPITHPEISGDVLGYVELRWSTGCKTNWSRVTIKPGAPYAVPSLGIMTWATRPSDGANTRGHHGDPGPYYSSSAFSDQLYGLNMKVCAFGQLAYQSINGPTGWATASYCF